MRIESKNRFRCFLLGTLFITSSTFGQVTQIFDGHSATVPPFPAHTNVDVSTNYVGEILPNASVGDTAEFDGRLPGNLVLNYIGNWQSGPGSSGVNLHLTSNQVGSVYIDNLNGQSNPQNFAFDDITIDAGAGAFYIGSDTNTLNYAGRPSGAIHHLINNSTNTATIGSRIHMIAGGGSPFTFDFMGTGNWQVNDFLVTDSTPNNNTSFQVDSSGIVTWYPSTPSGVFGTGNSINSVTVNSGLMILATNYSKISGVPFVINGAFRFDCPLQPSPQVFNGVVSGTGVLQVVSGTLTLAGPNVFSGTNLLSGGELVAGKAENIGVSGPLGVGGKISFAGGTLGYSAANAFDYSSRFDPAPGQAYSIDTAGQSVVFNSALSSVGGSLTKLGLGTLTLAGANSYTGTTTVSGGKLVIQRLSGTGGINVADAATLGVMEGSSQILPGTLILGATSTLEFNNVTNLTVPPLVAGSISASGPVIINPNSGPFDVVGQSYPLFSWNSGPAPAVVLANPPGIGGVLSTNGNTIVFTVTATREIWTGGTSGIWDTVTAGNWQQSGTPVIFDNSQFVQFDDTATGTPTIAVGELVHPPGIIFNNNTLAYSVTSSGGNFIGGNGTFTKTGSQLLTLSGGINTNSGGIFINGGAIRIGVLANGGLPSDLGAAGSGASNLVFDGGSLQYTGGPVDVDRLFTLGSGGGTIDSSGTGALRWTNFGAVAMSGQGPRALTLTGTVADTNILAMGIGNAPSGPASLIKSGATTWVLTGTNTYSGPTTINGGLLQIGAGGASGTIGSGNVTNNGGLIFNRTGTVTVSGSISGTGPLTNNGPGTLILAADNSYASYPFSTVINAGTVQIGNGGGSGSLFAGSAIIDNGTLIFKNTNLVILSGFGSGISGTGNVIVYAGKVKAIGNNSYSGWTEIDAAATLQLSEGNAGIFSGSGVITNFGTLFLTRQDFGVFGITNNIVGSGNLVVDVSNQNFGLVSLLGTNTYTGGTFIGGAGIILGDGITPNAGTIFGTVTFTNTTGPVANSFTQNKRLIFNHPEDFVFTNDVISRVSDGSTILNSGSIEQMGPGRLTLLGNNDYSGGTTIDAGMTLQVGNGGLAGSVGTNGVANEGFLVLNRAGTLTIGGPISGTAGTVAQIGPGTVILAASNTLTGAISVSNGTLVITATAGDLRVAGGTLAVGSLTTPTNLFIGGALNLSGGTMLFPLNKSLAQSNAFVNVVGSITLGGGSLSLTNAGPVLAAGDTFKLFGQSVPGGASVIVTGGGAKWINNLAVDGTITVASLVGPPLNFTLATANSLQFNWDTTHGSYKLQWQTNNLGTNWGDYPGGSLPGVTVPIDQTLGGAFFRLLSTP